MSARQPPALPTPPTEAGTPSMLSRKFGPEVANYFAGCPLNRVSFLRPDHAFLESALRHASTRFLLFRNMGPLVSKDRLHVVPWAEAEALVDTGNGGPYQKTEEQIVKEYDSRTWMPLLVFLGLDRRTEKDDGVFSYRDRYRGTPYFALDLSSPPPFLGSQDGNPALAAANALAEKYTKDGYEFVANRMNLSLLAEEAAIYAEARHVVDWNARNPFCGQCGNRTLSTNAGWKRTCPPADAAFSTERPPCATRKGVSNLSFPRTDAVIITAVVSADGNKLLLGRQGRFPPGMYSTLAGFLEPGEALEEAVRREVWEEAGVNLTRVVLHSSQPWPYPANIMIGAIAQAVPGEDSRATDLGNDAELEDASWFSVEQVREALKAAERSESGIGASDPIGGETTAPKLKVPPRTAIANQLMEAVCNGGFLGGVTKM